MPDEMELSFEGAMTRIEQIVANLERGEPSLSVALASYEMSVKLLRYCYQLLDQAEHSVALLTSTDERGGPLTAPFDASATLAPASDPSPASVGAGPRPKASARGAGSRARPAPRDDVPESSDPPF